MAARSLRLPVERVIVEHGEGGPPRVAEPMGSGLSLSSASRDGFAALAVAAAPVEIDVEVAVAGGRIPWNVLHPIEAAAIEPLRGQKQAMAFARLWVPQGGLPEGPGGRARAGSVVQFAADRAVITDPLADAGAAQATTLWRGHPAGWAAVSVVILESRA
jgi:hypothetical protein